MELKNRLATLASLALMTMAPNLALTQHEHQQHQVPASGGAVAQLQLKDGQKWQTDAPLRSSMASIRAVFDADHPAIHAGKQTDAQYATLATHIEQQVKAIVANCRLPADADANLHFVVADLLQGVSLMRGADPQHSRHDGAARVHGALNAYGQYFDDPAWQPDAPMHEK